jgi:hypothetical protein
MFPPRATANRCKGRQRGCGGPPPLPATTLRAQCRTRPRRQVFRWCWRQSRRLPEYAARAPSTPRDASKQSASKGSQPLPLSAGEGRPRPVATSVAPPPPAASGIPAHASCRRRPAIFNTSAPATRRHPPLRRLLRYASDQLRRGPLSGRWNVTLRASQPCPAPFSACGTSSSMPRPISPAT